MNMTITRQEISHTSEKGEHTDSLTPPAPFEIEKKNSKNTPFFEVEEAALHALHQAIDEEKLLIEAGAALPFPLLAPLETSFPLNAFKGVEIVPELADLFEHCVQAMVHINVSGVSETTFYLDTPHFSGTKIVITEFNTAPKAFNISLAGAPQSIALFNKHATDLLACFQKSPFNFTIHRLESDIDLHLVKSTEETSDQEDEEQR